MFSLILFFFLFIQSSFVISGLILFSAAAADWAVKQEICLQNTAGANVVLKPAGVGHLGESS